jgi:hypothetical protein
MPQPYQLGPAFTNPPRPVPPSTAWRPASSSAPRSLPTPSRAPVPSPVPSASVRIPVPLKNPPTPFLDMVLSKTPKLSQMVKLRDFIPAEDAIHGGFGETAVDIAEDVVGFSEASVSGMAAWSRLSSWSPAAKAGASISGAASSVTQAVARAAPGIASRVAPIAGAVANAAPKVIGPATGVLKGIAQRSTGLNTALYGLDAVRFAADSEYRDAALDSPNNWKPAKVFSFGAAMQAAERPFSTYSALAYQAYQNSDSKIAASQKKSDVEYEKSKREMDERVRKKKAARDASDIPQLGQQNDERQRTV